MAKAVKSRKTHWVYIILCANGSYYTGYTTDLERRTQEHLAGSPKSKYTRAFKALKVVQSWKFKDRSTALKMEAQIKKLNRAEKELLISDSLYQSQTDTEHPPAPSSHKPH